MTQIISLRDWIKSNTRATSIRHGLSITKARQVVAWQEAVLRIKMRYFAHRRKALRLPLERDILAIAPPRETSTNEPGTSR